MTARILLIGASRGIGLELVRQYRAAGSAVTATARSAEGLAQIEALGARALRVDVASATQASTLAWNIDGERYDTVIYNAGVYGPRSSGLEPPTQAEFDAVMHTNVLGAMRVLPQVAEGLAPGARVAMISSRMGSMGLRTDAGGWLYRASKAALNSVLKDLSITLQGRAICVALHPGWVRTDMGGAGADLDVSTSAQSLRRTLASLKSVDNGGFFNHDGAPLAW
jgi:NAD(P)-dependent dehydrogenase (short-subunit alcohol dehydrogenase family)